MKLVNFSPLPGAVITAAIEQSSDITGLEVEDVHLLPEERIVAAVADADIVLGDFSFKTPITAKSSIGASSWIFSWRMATMCEANPSRHLYSLLITAASEKPPRTDYPCPERSACRISEETQADPSRLQPKQRHRLA